MKKIIYDGKTLEELLQKHYSSEIRILSKNKGNTGYFVEYVDSYHIRYGYEFISKKQIINRICGYYCDKRKMKLISLKIFND